MIKFCAGICQNSREDFSDHSQLLDYINHRLLPICNSPRGYKFNIHFYSDENTVMNVIGSLLQMPELKCCSNLEISLNTDMEQERLPVKEISNWLELERSVDAMENIFQNKKERFLEIAINQIQNAHEMIEHLANVICFK